MGAFLWFTVNSKFRPVLVRCVCTAEKLTKSIVGVGQGYACVAVCFHCVSTTLAVSHINGVKMPGTVLNIYCLPTGHKTNKQNCSENTDSMGQRSYVLQSDVNLSPTLRMLPRHRCAYDGHSARPLAAGERLSAPTRTSSAHRPAS